MKITIDYSKRVITLTYLQSESETHERCLRCLQWLKDISERPSDEEETLPMNYGFTSDLSEDGDPTIEIKSTSWVSSFESIVRDCQGDLRLYLRAAESTTIIPWSPWALLPWAGSSGSPSPKTDAHHKLE